MTEIERFTRGESGAVTVDWVVLTAALVGLGLAVMGVVSQGVQSASTNITGALQSDSLIGDGFRNDSGGLDYGD